MVGRREREKELTLSKCMMNIMIFREVNRHNVLGLPTPKALAVMKWSLCLLTNTDLGIFVESSVISLKRLQLMAGSCIAALRLTSSAAYHHGLPARPKHKEPS